MNRDLELLSRWASERAQDDPDEAARPLWSQIASEVDGYLAGDEPAQVGADLFGGAT